MKRVIKSADEHQPIRDLKEAKQYLWKQIGSRLDPQEAYVVNLGDGDAYIMIEDTSSGEFMGGTISQSEIQDYGVEVIDRILSSWED